MVRALPTGRGGDAGELERPEQVVILGLGSVGERAPRRMMPFILSKKKQGLLATWWMTWRDLP